MRRIGYLVVGALACGPAAGDPSLDESGSGSESGSGGDAPLDYSECEQPGPSFDAIDHPDTARFDELFAQAINGGGYGEYAHLVEGQMIRNVVWTAYCSRVTLRFDWLGINDYACFEHGDEAEMQAQFAEYISGWPVLPATIIPIAEVETLAESCFAGIYRPYQPCYPNSPFSFQLHYTNDRQVAPCAVETDVATVDLATGTLAMCETIDGGGGCDDGG